MEYIEVTLMVVTIIISASTGYMYRLCEEIREIAKKSYTKV